MNNNTNNTKKNTAELFSDSLISSSKLIKPKRDWCILVSIFTILILIVLIFDFYMYKKTVSGDMYVSVQRNELTIEDLKVNEIEKILKKFDDRKNIVNNLKIEKVSDPSL